MTTSATDVGTWVLGVATGALAVFTAVMAWYTRKAVEAGKRTADAAEQDIRQGAELVRSGKTSPVRLNGKPTFL